MTRQEEILKHIYSEIISNPDKIYEQHPSIVRGAYIAMDEYAKEQAILFYQHANGLNPEGTRNMVGVLYDKFFKSQNK